MFGRFVGVAAVLGGVVLLSGCGGGGVYLNSEDTAYSVGEAGFSEEVILLDDGSLISCLEDGSGKSRVVSCVVVEETDLPVVPVGEAGFTVEFIVLGNGDKVQCFEGGAGKSRVVSCVPLALR